MTYPFSLERIAEMHQNSLVAWDRDSDGWTPRQGDPVIVRLWNRDGTAFWSRRTDGVGRHDGIGCIIQIDEIDYSSWRIWVLIRDDQDSLGIRWLTLP